MITIPTVLVLGAGASKPYGFPTARQLVRSICAMFSPDNRNTPQFRAGCYAALRAPEELVNFRDTLFAAYPASIDSWLEKPENKGLQDIGKAAIATRLA